MGQLPASRRYNVAFQARLRRELAPLVEAGLTVCARCGERILPGEPFDLGHVDGTDRTVYSGPEHRACNPGDFSSQAGEWVVEEMVTAGRTKLRGESPGSV